MEDIEKRVISTEGLEIRTDDGKRVIEGYAAVFDQVASIGLFDEVIRRGAFSETLSKKPDVRATIEHEGGLTTIGRTTAGTLELQEDDHGLRVKIWPPDTQAGRDAAILLERGDINQMSFAFRVPEGGDERVRGKDARWLRVLKQIDLNDGDVALVSYPAYSSTTAWVRDRYAALNQEVDAPLVEAENDAERLQAKRKAKQRTIQLLEVKR